jgi:lipopolysaccharide export system permease protein
VPLLTKYIAREYLRVFWLSLGALLLIYVVSEVFAKIGKFARYDADVAALFAYFALKIPRALYEMAPLAALMASVLAMTTLSRQHEITALRACGVGLFRIAWPIVLVSLGLGAAAFAANWSWIPATTARAQDVKTVRIEGRPAPAALQRARVWMRLEHRAFLNVRMVDPESKSLYGVRFYQVGDHFALMEEIDAPEVRYQGGGWMAPSGIHRLFRADGTIDVERFTDRPIDFLKTPEDFLQLEIKEEHLEYPQLREYVNGLVSSGIDPGRYAVDLATRASVPFVIVVMALLGIPFGLGDTRRGGWGMAVGMSLVLGLAYWIVHSLAVSLGRGGVLPTWLAAWAANGIFLTIGATLLLQKRH